VNFNQHILITNVSLSTGAYLADLLLKTGFTNITGIRFRSEKHPLEEGWDDSINIIEGNIADYFFIKEILTSSSIICQTHTLQDHLIYENSQVFEKYRDLVATWVNAGLEMKIPGFIHIAPAWLPYIPGQTITIREDTTSQPNQIPHRCHKSLLFAELEVHRGIAEGLPASVLSTGTVLGKECGLNGITKVLTWIKHEKKYPTGSGAYVYAGDVAKAALSIITGNIWKEKFVLSENVYEHKHIYTLLAKELFKIEKITPLNFTGFQSRRLIQKLRRLFKRKNTDLPTAWLKLQQTHYIWNQSKSIRYNLTAYTPLHQVVELM
jgi:dihydroflavonol-4-reductase